ncbi:hypothetical protein Godav_005249 [Gossypium davidsonii]|uniref:SAM-dependent MTase RsmB/NOP-type domain-containing protein n=2 Tax=Gossypium TaxID=3633 RepID=A0A7J8TGN6_GOSDV|nr:hypothetical protein [Gossypium davidsonii]MBA0643253.1 hypothetical protein [Gossypium klotzschianum]
MKPGNEAEIEGIEAEIKCKLEKVNWLPGFYSLRPDILIANSKSYLDGKIYGIDAASGAAVSVLNISPGDHVLDLCAAPGAKLCMMLDLLGDSGSVTGVDVARHRLAACRTMLQKYSLGDRCRLFVADGTTFSLAPLRVDSRSRSCESSFEEKDERFREWTSRRPWKERKRAAKARETMSLQSVTTSENPELIFYGRHSGVVGLSKNKLYKTMSDLEVSSCGYDKVLVDAECTHDGSVKHIQKFENWGWTTLQRRVLDAVRTDSLTLLQAMPFFHHDLYTYIYCLQGFISSCSSFTVLRFSKYFRLCFRSFLFVFSQLKLLRNGFRLLKVRGLLVYSTCSLTVAQNEDIVEQFLKENASAGSINSPTRQKSVILPSGCLELQEINEAEEWPCKSGRIPKTLRFDPLTSQTSGLFVAKFTKLAA